MIKDMEVECKTKFSMDVEFSFSFKRNPPILPSGGMKNPLPVVFSIHVRAAFQDGPGDIEEDEEDENKEQRVLQSGHGDTAAGSGVRFSEGLYLRQLFAENADNRHHRCDSCRRYDSPGDEGRRRRQERRMTPHGSGEDRKVHRGAEKGKEDDPVAAGREAGSQLQGCQQMGDRGFT